MKLFNVNQLLWLTFAFVLIAMPAFADLVIINGSFEEPVVESNTNFTGSFSFTGWSGVSTGNGSDGNAGLVDGVDFGLSPLDGNQHFSFNGNNPPAGTFIEQTFATQNGVRYTVTFGIGRNSGAPDQLLSLNAQVFNATGDQLESLSAQAPSSVSYDIKSFSFTANSSTSRLRLTDTSSSNPNTDVFVDAVSVVPEQSTAICDEFITGLLNSNLWTVSLPFAESQMFQTNGRAVFIARGGLTSTPIFFKALDVRGRFRFMGNLDQFKILLRTDGTEDVTWHERNGIALNFSQIHNQITLDEFKTNGFTQLGQTNYAFVVGADVNFRIIDNGTNIQVYINSAIAPSIVGSSSYDVGDKISVYNRENDDSRSELDFICISPLIPRLEIFKGVELRWVSITNQVYQLQSSTNLVEWSNFGAVINTPGGTTNQVPDPTASPSKFYRLEVN